MRLRRVVISGFKTFARRSEVSLEPGITAIVGPNGSGKSNLVDAIRWALGETNARELRGARMDEVIYSGGNGRGRMGFAEVELVLDNEEGRLPVDDAEVSVSRRVVRHGDSEFRLNGDRVRLRDLERVLGTTGLTQDGYAVVAQNDIDAIIEATPAQRRALVEQAAGVRALRAACEDALMRVGQAEGMVQRFDDLLGETEPRLAELAGQAELALEQRELTGRLSSLRGSLAREAWRGARVQLRQARRRLDSAEQRLAAAAAAEAAFAHRLGQHRTRLEQQRARHAAASGHLEETRLLAERAAGDQRRGADRARAGVLARATAALELGAAVAEEEARRLELGAVSGAGGPGGGEAEDARQRLLAAAAVHADAVAAEAAANGALVAAEAALRAAEQARADADAAARRTASELRLVADATTALRERVDVSQRRTADAEQRLATAAAAAADAAEAVAGAEAARRQTEAELAGSRSAAAAAQAALDGARVQARVALARAAALRGQVEGALGGRGAIADAVAAGEVRGRRVVDSFTVDDPADAPAVEAALEAHIGAWIVADLDAAAAMLDAGSAREALVWQGVAPTSQPAAPDGARRAIDAVTPREGAAAAVAHCLVGAWLVADRATARRVLAAAAGRAVLPDGTVVTAAELRGGGRPGRTLELASSEREAAAGADAAMAAERAAEAERAATQERAAAAATADERALDALTTARLEAAEVQAAARAAEQALAEERHRADLAATELAARQVAQEPPDSEATAAAALADAEARLLGARAQAEAAAGAAAAARQDTAAAAATLRDAETAEARLAAVAADREQRLAGATQALEAAALRSAAAAARVLGAELDALAALARAGAARAAVGTTTVAVAEALAVIAAVAPELADSERAVAAVDAERSEVAVVLARAEDERRGAEAEVESASRRVAELAEAVRGDEEDEGPEPEAGDAEKAEREIVRLERRIAALGPVNALAPEEHERVAARVLVLRAGRDDLGNACADIRAVAARLTNAIDSRFEAVFGAVSVHFHELFAELFPGGRATLRREEPAADDEAAADGRAGTRRAGVEILAQPPGKRLQPLSLFSGGERALTALAVILALQQVNPSPFYVFDEVDAPLDDSNVLRFTRLLTRLAAEQQFIVVTHNHITMAAADALHGVTSDGDGVSSVISVRFDPDSGETVPEGHVVGLRQRAVRAAV